MGYIDDLIEKKFIDKDLNFFQKAKLRNKFYKDAVKVFKDFLAIPESEILADETLLKSDLLNIYPYDYNLAVYDLNSIDEAIITNELFNMNFLKKIQQITMTEFLLENNIGTGLLKYDQLRNVIARVGRFHTLKSNFERISFGKNVKEPLDYLRKSRNDIKRYLKRYWDNIS